MKQLTYKQACEKIAEVWNKGKSEVKLTGQDIFNLHPGGELWFIPDLYEAANTGLETFEGLILTDEYIAMLFCLKIRSKK